MSGPMTLLEEFATELRDLCQADGSAVLVHLEPPQRSSFMLASAGASRIPEFASEEAAWSFIAGQNAGIDGDSGEGGIRQQTSRDGSSTLICLPLSHILPRPAEHAPLLDERRKYPRVHTAPDLDGNIWIGISAAAQVDKLIHLLKGFEAADSAPATGEAQLARFVTLSARLAWQVYHLSRVLRDPVSLLPGRMEFEVFLTRALAAARAKGQPLGVLLINPDDFVMVNHRFGRELGDHAVREVAERLGRCVRDTDGIFRYGGAAFGVVLPATDLANTRTAAEKFRRQLSEAPYLGDSLELAFTIGGAVADLPSLELSDLEPADMVQRADAALNRAKLAGGGQILLSPMSESSAGLNHFDPLSGIFTTDTEKDYRNMLLLWETVSLVSSTPDPELIAGSFVDRLGARFRPDRLALFTEDARAELKALATNVRDDSTADGRAAGREVRLSAEQIKVMRNSLTSGHVERHRNGQADSPMASTAYAVPLLANKKAIGCLFLDGINRRLQLDSTDLIFLNALADQVAIALDRAALSATWIRDKEQETQQLGRQVKELREVLGQSKLIYESPQMQDVLNTL
jgi:diguanylate cyclase (GGDEF)-like protein